MHSLDSDMQQVTSDIYIFSMNHPINHTSSLISNPNINKALSNKKKMNRFKNKLIRCKSDFNRFGFKKKPNKEKSEELSLLIENSNTDRIKSIFSTPNLMIYPKSMRFYQTIKRNLDDIPNCNNIKIFDCENVKSKYFQEKTNEKDKDKSKNKNSVSSLGSSFKITPKFNVIKGKDQQEKIADKQKQLRLANTLLQEVSNDKHNKMRTNSSCIGNKLFNLKQCKSKVVSCKKNNNNKKYHHKNPHHPQQRQLTGLSNKKCKEELPITYPVFVSLNNQYDSISEKQRHEKIMDKFIKLKSFILKDKDNAYNYIKEFLIKNNITNSNYYTNEKLNNFNQFLKKKFAFDSKKTLQEILTEAINYEYPQNEENAIDKNEAFAISHHHFDQDKLKQNNEGYKTQSYFRHRPNVNKNNFHSLSLEKDLFFNQVHRNKNRKDLKGLINELEKKFNGINKEHTIQVKQMHKILNKPKMNRQLSYNNLLIPNLCLKNKVLHSTVVNGLTKENETIDNECKHKKKIFDINKRLYYALTNRDKEKQIEKIRRHNQLTEFIILQRSKKVLYIEERKEKVNKEKLRYGFL